MTSEPRFLHIYCDESRQMAHRYMVLGGVILDRKFENLFNGWFQYYRDTRGMHAELKWAKVSMSKLPEYKEVVNIFRYCCDQLYFKAIVVDTHQMNIKKFNKGNRDDAIDHMFYQFLVHMFGRHLGEEDKCIVNLDFRNSSQKLSDLQRVTNNGLRKEYGFQHDPIRELRAIDSKDSCYIQIADILMGAIGYQVNGDCDKPNASQAKCALMNYVLSRFSLDDFLRSTAKSRQEFSIWHFQFRETEIEIAT